MKKAFLILFSILVTCQLNWAQEVIIKTTYKDHESLRFRNFESDAFSTHQVALIERLTTFFSESDEQISVRILQTFSPNQIPYYSFSSKPFFADSIRHALQKALLQIPVECVAKYLPFSTLHEIEINGGNKDRKLTFLPKIEPFNQIRIRPYANVSYEVIRKSNQSICTNGILPILISLLDDQSETMLNTHAYWAYLQKKLTKNEKIDALELTDEQVLYWDAMQELKAYPNLMTVLKVTLLISEGKTEYASAILQMIYQFEGEESLLYYLMEELNWRLTYALSAQKSLPKMEQPLLYNSNPMHTVAIQPESPEQAYRAYLRSTIKNLFIDAETFENDFPKYASIALDLKNYGFAADLFWMLATNRNETNDELRNSYLLKYEFALHKLGVKPVINRKKRKQFKRMDKKFRKQMKRHEEYKNFKP